MNQLRFMRAVIIRFITFERTVFDIIQVYYIVLY